MQIIVNGQTRQFGSPLSVTGLLGELALAGRRVAVEINGAIVPASERDARLLTDGDRVEVVQAIGGG